MRNRILLEAYLPFTLSTDVISNILVRSDVPPLTLPHPVGAQINAIDPDQQVNAEVRDLEHSITGQPEW